MASGCNNSSPLDKCSTVTSSNCVKMQNATDDFDCQGDTLTEIIDSIKERLNTTSEGGNILDVEFDCPYIVSQMAGKEISALNVLRVMLNSICEIKQDVEDAQAVINVPVVYDVKCLTGNPSTTPQVVQALIDKICILVAQVTSISSQLINQGNITTTIQNTTATTIKAAITSCTDEYGITKTGIGPDVSISIDALVPPCSAIWVWDATMLSFFDAQGKGLAGKPFCGWYICNGLNGTPNMFGYTTAQATALTGVAGTADTRVVSNSDVSYASAVGDKKGEVKHKLTSDENGAHTHTLNDPGHSHTTADSGALGLKGDSNPNYYSRVTNGSTPTSSSQTNITMANSGGGVAHENRQPTAYGFYITRKYN